MAISIKINGFEQDEDNAKAAAVFSDHHQVKKAQENDDKMSVHIMCCLCHCITAYFGLSTLFCLVFHPK